MPNLVEHPSSGETRIAELLVGMRPIASHTVYLFCTMPAGNELPADCTPVMMFRETEGITYVLPQSECAAHGLQGVFPCRMITLSIHSALEAVGLTAAISRELAGAGMPANLVAGYYHDHLFVPAESLEEAMTLLEKIASATGVQTQSTG